MTNPVHATDNRVLVIDFDKRRIYESDMSKVTLSPATGSAFAGLPWHLQPKGGRDA